MARFSDELLERIRHAAPLELVVEDYVALKKSGRHLKGLCPFHAEKTPSFTVSPDSGLFYCYGCHRGGNVFTFVMDIENVSFPEAVRRVAERFGVPLPRQDLKAGEGILTVNRWAQGVYHDFLLRDPGGRQAREYLRERQIRDESIERFVIGAAPAQWQYLVTMAQREGVPSEALLEAGLAVRRRDGTGLVDRFRHRLMFPLHGPSGHVLGFAGRVLPDNPDSAKYVNSAQTAAYHKSHYLYGMYQARKAMAERGHAILVEGYLDAVRCHERGFTETVAVSGTSLTEEQVALLRRKVAEVVVLFDGDPPGRLAAQRALGMLLEASLSCRVAVLPEGEDPDSFLLARGTPALEALLEAAPTAVQYLVAEAQRVTRSPTEVVRRVGPVLSRIRDPLLREEVAGELARTLGFTPRAVLSALGRIQTRETAGERQVNAPMAAWEEQVCRHLLLRPAERRQILAEVSPGDFEHPMLARLCEEVAAQPPGVDPGRVVQALGDPELRRLATRLAVGDDPLGPVEKDLARFKIERSVRQMRALRAQLRDAERRGSSSEVRALLATLRDLGATVDRIRSTLAGMPTGEGHSGAI